MYRGCSAPCISRPLAVSLPYAHSVDHKKDLEMEFITGAWNRLENGCKRVRRCFFEEEEEEEKSPKPRITSSRRDKKPRKLLNNNELNSNDTKSGDCAIAYKNMIDMYEIKLERVESHYRDQLEMYKKTCEELIKLLEKKHQ